MNTSSIDRGDVKLAYDRAVAHDVEDVAEMLVSFAQYAENLEKQRDDLLAASKDVIAWCDITGSGQALFSIRMLRKAIDSVENHFPDAKKMMEGCAA